MLGWMLLASYRSKCSTILPLFFKPRTTTSSPQITDSMDLLDMPISISAGADTTCSFLPSSTSLIYSYVLTITASLFLNLLHDALPTGFDHPSFWLSETSMSPTTAISQNAVEARMLILRDVLLLAILPFLWIQFFVHLPLWFHYGILFATATLCIAMAISQHLFTPVLYIVMWTVCAVCIAKDNHFRNLRLFYTSMRSAPTNNVAAIPPPAPTFITEDTDELQPAMLEVKKMMANVAHDLKTPLSSFMAGIDNIEYQLLSHDQQPTTISPVKQKKSIRYCLAHIRNSHHFMLMSINRCIDSTKASSGLKLVPKLDTIPLEKTLNLPLQIMQYIQQQIKMFLSPIDPDICSHIITDQQWLQENVLCLLSNAIKYSHGGEVSVSAHLEHISSDGYKPKSNKPSVVLPSNPSQPLSTRCCTWDSVEQEVGIVEDGSVVDGWEHRSSAGSRETYVRIEVEDTGIGMSDEAMASLFSPFKQTQRLAGGTGLGLYSLAKRLDALGGRYGVMKRRDGRQGSLFWFAFPYRPDDDAVSALSMSDDDEPDGFEDDDQLRVSVSPDKRKSFQGIETPTISRRSSSFDKTASVTSASQHLVDIADYASSLDMASVLPAASPPVTPRVRRPSSFDEALLNVLLVDDSASIRKMTKLMLSKHAGYAHVTEAGNGAEALQLVEKSYLEGNADNVFDVILMDLQMPIMDGMEAIRRIRALETTSGTKKQVIVAMSANEDPDTVQEVLKLGANFFISKPFKIAEFQHLLRSASALY